MYVCKNAPFCTYTSASPGDCPFCHTPLVAQAQPTAQAAAQPAAQASPPAAAVVPALAVQGLAGPVADGYPAVIGGRETWTVSSPNTPGANITGLSFDVTPAGAIVGNYTATDTAGAVTPFAAGAGQATFHWATSGAVTIVVTADVNGQAATTTIAVTVASPALAHYSAQTGVSQILAPLRVPGDPASSVCTLSFGNTALQRPGIAATATVNLPAGFAWQGKLCMTQTFRVNRPGTAADGAALPDGVSPGEVVDREFIYPFECDGEECDGPFDTAAGAATHTLTTDDTPSSLLGGSGPMLVKQSVRIDETYHLYVMFKPTGGVWVALGEIVWRWQASATYTGGAGQLFALFIGAQSSENTALAASAVFPRMPLWTGNADDYLDETE
ncbi:hypothetical protein [Burkholderia plantarii]|uniref:Uncharacterized protein n=1 Tax=Burkholderia plantarii TaxID=41899 RepID=A0A0B6RUW6_BURPL|nr:hypothetical protein [Burkholderia plantarii]AJK49152.1 hypothetical protein BGL_2c10740 [Burkholderia plantarii]